MSVQDELQQLYELSEIDLQIYAIRKKVADAPGRRQEIDKNLAELSKSYEEKKSALERIEREKRGLETELQISKDRFSAFHQKMNQLKTNKEYQAALKEVAETKQANKLMEDRILQLMSEIELLQKGTQETEVLYKAEKEKGEQEMRRIDEEEKKVQEKASVFLGRRKELISKITPRYLKHYEKIHNNVADAVSVVNQGTCQGCNMRIPPQLYNEILRITAIHLCPSCQRILYVRGGSS